MPNGSFKYSHRKSVGCSGLGQPTIWILLTSSRLIRLVLSREGAAFRNAQVRGSAVALFVLLASGRKARASRNEMIKFLMCLGCLSSRNLTRFFETGPAIKPSLF